MQFKKIVIISYNDRTPDSLLRECSEDLEVQADSHNHSPTHHHLVHMPARLFPTRRILLITARPLSSISITSPTHKQQHSNNGSSTSNKVVLYLILLIREVTSPKYQEGPQFVSDPVKEEQGQELKTNPPQVSMYLIY